MKFDRLDDHTINMSRDELLFELNDQIEITAEMMRLHREEIAELRLECKQHQQNSIRWRWSFYLLLLILIVIAFYLL